MSLGRLGTSWQATNRCPANLSSSLSWISNRLLFVTGQWFVTSCRHAGVE